MEKLELIECITEAANDGFGLRPGDEYRYNKDNLNNKDLKALLNNYYAEYDVIDDGEFIIIRRKIITKDTTFTLRISSDVKKRMQAAAAAENRSLSNYIVQLFLEKEGGENG